MEDIDDSDGTMTFGWQVPGSSPLSAKYFECPVCGFVARSKHRTECPFHGVMMVPTTDVLHDDDD